MVIFVLRRHDDGKVARRRELLPEWEEFARGIGHNLARAREAKGMSQEHVAHMAGIAGYTYQKYEKGESRPGTPLNPQLTTLLALCQVLEVSVEDLLPQRWPDFTAGR